jgi:hypothetical protein
MANMYRKQKVTDHANERRFSFVAQIPTPEGGFASILDAIKAWHCYNTSMQRPERGQRPGERGAQRWNFESMQIAEGFRLRFGGEIGGTDERAPQVSPQQTSPQGDTARQCRDDIRGRRAPVVVRRKRG